MGLDCATDKNHWYEMALEHIKKEELQAGANLLVALDMVEHYAKD
jgi:hypothetical protein